MEVLISVLTRVVDVEIEKIENLAFMLTWLRIEILKLQCGSKHILIVVWFDRGTPNKCITFKWYFPLHL